MLATIVGAADSTAGMQVTGAILITVGGMRTDTGGDSGLVVARGIRTGLTIRIDTVTNIPGPPIRASIATAPHAIIATSVNVYTRMADSVTAHAMFGRRAPRFRGHLLLVPGRRNQACADPERPGPREN